MSLFDSARFLTSAAAVSQLPGAGLPEIAFAGRSNAGKSTTINVLTRQGRLAFASKTPGRTQLINFFTLSRKIPDSKEREQIAHLVDLPGYGYAKAAPEIRETWSRLIGGYLADRPSLTGIVIVMDARRPFMPADEWLIDFFRHAVTCASSGSLTNATRSSVPNAIRCLPKPAPALNSSGIMWKFSFSRDLKKKASKNFSNDF